MFMIIRLAISEYGKSLVLHYDKLFKTFLKDKLFEIKY